MAMLISVSLSTFAGTTTCTESNNRSIEITIPTNMIVKQTISFNNGKKVVVYYQKEGDVCKLYSTTDVTKYSESDLASIKSTTFEVYDYVEGKCYVSKKTSDIMSFAMSMFKQIK